MLATKKVLILGNLVSRFKDFLKNCVENKKSKARKKIIAFPEVIKWGRPKLKSTDLGPMIITDICKRAKEIHM